MPLLRSKTVGEVREVVRAFRAAGERIALVPTMGALHDGHLALVRLGKESCERVVASIFVNPRQFAPGEDLARYPRDLDGDAAKLEDAGCDAIWAPDVDVVYPEGFASRVEVAGAAEGLESDFRPHHFGGVATVCLKLFTTVGPDVAVFGEKDYQQLCVLRQMARDFALPLEIVAGETVREADGLAMSSRNTYLTPEERNAAPALSRALKRLAEAIAPEADLTELALFARTEILAAGFQSVDYVEVRHADSLAAIDAGSTAPMRVLGAARIGSVRLVDNVPVPLRVVATQ